MAKMIACRDIGVDCDFVARADTMEDLLQQCREHARTAHNMTDLPPELITRMRASVHEEAA